MRRRGSLATPLLLALVLYSAWSPSAFVASPPPRPRRAVSLGAAGEDDALRNLLLGDISSAGVKAPTEVKAKVKEAAPAKVKEAAPAKKAPPAAKAKEAAPAKKAAKAPAPAPKAAEEVPAKVAKAPADDLKAAAEKKGAAAAQSESPMPKAASVPAGVLTKDDQGRWRFVEVDRDAQLLAAFQSFDINGDGELCRDELKEAAAKFGESEKQIGELLKQFDGKGNGSISFDQFKQLIASAEEACDVEKEECFSLKNPSTWGLLFRRRKK